MDPIFKDTRNSYRRGFIVVLTLGVVIAFFVLIKDLFVTVVVSAILSSLLFPYQRRLEALLKGRRGIASGIVLCLGFLIVGIPFLGLLGVAAREALQVSASVKPWLQEQMAKPVDQWLAFFEQLPFFDELKVYQTNILEAFSNLLQVIGSRLTAIISAATTQTVEFIFKTFVAIYSGYFFLNDGDKIYRTLTGYLPLTRQEVNQIAERVLLLIRSSIKSLFIIGFIQGSLVTAAFSFLGIKGAVFWGIVAAALSAIPGVGAPVVWVPAVFYLFVINQIGAAIGLALWGVLVVGLVDNFLRPILIGQDTKIPELLIFFAMLGGLSVFGLAGFMIGPVVVSLLISVLEIYQKALRPERTGTS